MKEIANDLLPNDLIKDFVSKIEYDDKLKKMAYEKIVVMAKAYKEEVLKEQELFGDSSLLIAGTGILQDVEDKIQAQSEKNHGNITFGRNTLKTNLKEFINDGTTKQYMFQLKILVLALKDGNISKPVEEYSNLVKYYKTCPDIKLSLFEAKPAVKKLVNLINQEFANFKEMPEQSHNESVKLKF